jgi:signal transduction histidine kinase
MVPNRQDRLAKDGLKHDLRNVFQTILQAAALVSSDEAHRESAAVIVRNVERAERILGFLDSEDPVSLRESIETAVEFVRDAASARHVPALSFHFRGPDVRLRISASALDRALVNLFVNIAEAASLAGFGTVNVILDGGFADGGYRLTVADDGPGIPDALVGRVFTPRVSGQPGGEGLGLFVARSALEACGGTILAANGENGGAVFTVLFPATAVRMAASAAVPSIRL